MRGFILASAVSYLTAIAALLMGYRLQAGVSVYAEVAEYLGMTVFLSLILKYPQNKLLSYVAASLLGIGGVGGFSGFQKWIDYSGYGNPNPILGPAMCFWNLSLATAIISEHEKHTR